MAHSTRNGIPTLLMILTTICLIFSASASESINELQVPASTISAAPSLSSSSLALSPDSDSDSDSDISPVFPTPHLSPTESSLPIIPSTPSPPKPDDDAMAAQGPLTAVAPSRFLPDSSSLRLVSGVITSLLLSAFVSFGLLQLSG